MAADELHGDISLHVLRPALLETYGLAFLDEMRSAPGRGGGLLGDDNPVRTSILGGIGYARINLFRTYDQTTGDYDLALTAWREAARCRRQRPQSLTPASSAPVPDRGCRSLCT